MAAPGIQLNSQIQLTYFQPTVDQYVEKIKQAVASQDKTAAEQALEQLEKAVPGAGQTGGNGSPSGASVRTWRRRCPRGGIVSRGHAICSGDGNAARMAA